MPIHKDFHSMLDSMTGQYCTGEDEDTTKTESAEGYPGKTCRKALGVFYATCKEKGLDYTKPMPKEKVREHVSAILPFTILEKIVDKPLKIRGLAITAGMSRNFNIYTPDELEDFASKLVAAPVYVEHVAVPNAVGKVTKTEWDGSNLFYEAEIYDEDTAAKIRKGLIQHVSVGADYETLDIVDGQVPHGLHNAELSLVAVPGIPETNVQVLEKLRAQKRIKEQDERCVFCGEPAEIWVASCLDCFKKLPLSESKKKELIEQFKMRKQQGPGCMAPAGVSENQTSLKGREKNMKDNLREQDGEIKPGEDESKGDFIQRCKVAGNDEPQCQVIWDKAHPGSSTAEQLEDSQITSDVCGVEPSNQEKLETKVSELLARVDKLEKDRGQGNVAESLLKKSKEPMVPVRRVIETLEGLLLSPLVERSSMGEQLHHQQIRKAIFEYKEMLKSG